MIATIIRPFRENQAYRLRCRFKIEPCPNLSWLDIQKVRVAEMFVKQMHAQGWEHDNRVGFRMTGPYPMVEPVTIHIRRTPSAREMLPYLLQGAKFRANGETMAAPMPKLATSEWWEYEIAGVFIRRQIMVESPVLGAEA